jgi:protein-S-isoprenylcysteine O-methyltransferase Ste14
LQTGLWHFVGLRQVVDPQVEADSPLVTTGLYRRMRHPLYTGGLLLIWLAPLMTVNLLIVFMWLTVYLVVGAKLEERRLSQTFGEAYRQYKQRVPMFIPSYRRAK